MDQYKTWCGVGVKGGGTLFAVGMEYLAGDLRNLGQLGELHSFQMMSVRIGPGLGGGAGYVACIVFDCLNLWNLNDTESSDWSINVALGGKWSEVVKGLSKYKFFPTLLKIGEAAGKQTALVPADIDNLRNGASYFWTGCDIGKRGNGPKLVTIDIPFAGVGVELSAHWTQGKIEILD